MSWFSESHTRREQIVAAARELLATTPLERLTTRAIASAVGVSQPALFRHFRSREALLLAVVEATRGDLEGLLAPLLGSGKAPLDLCDALARQLVQYVDEHPGFPRLLFADMALEAPDLRVAVHHLVSMQRTLIAELVSAAVRDGAARADVDPQAAATLFVGMIQGLVLQRELAGGGAPLAERIDAVSRLWRAGLAREITAAPPKPAPEPTLRKGTALALDVRPILARGVDPLSEILGRLSELTAGSVLVVTAPFRPRPLEALLGSRGHSVSVIAGEGGTHSLLCVLGGAPPVLDLRDLEPPEPLERVMSAVRGLGPADVFIAHLPRHPRWLLPHLARTGHSHEIVELCDGSAVLRVEGHA